MTSKPHKEFRMLSAFGRIYTVDGARVRKKRTVFIGGGHHLIYPWVPKGEIWIERMKGGWREERFILAHELTEIVLMVWRGWSYDKAHDAANKAEHELRTGGDPRSVFQSFVGGYFPRATPEGANTVVDNLTRVFEKYGGVYG